MKFKIVYQSLCFMIVSALFSCDSMESNYEEFTKNGEVIYAVKPSTVIVHGGNERLVLSLNFNAEPKVRKVKVFWNFRADSASFDIFQVNGQTIQLPFNNMAKGSYSFEIYTYDKEGNSSVKSEATGNVYDNAFFDAMETNILPLNSINIIERKGALGWYKTDYFAGIEVTYTDLGGSQKIAKVLGPPTLVKGFIPNVKPGSAFAYRTMYLPDINALDTAFSASRTGTFPIYSQLDKGKFNEYTIPPAGLKLPGDYTVLPAVLNNISLDLKKMWDDRYGDEDAYQSGTGALTAQTFTIDLGVTQKLGFLRVFQRGINGSTLEAAQLYNAGNIKRWELWGRTDTPNPDGTFTGWTKLGDFTTTKPSNSARGINTAADKTAANEGHLLEVPASAPAVRYLRWKIVENWGAVTNVAVNEIALYEPAY